MLEIVNELENTSFYEFQNSIQTKDIFQKLIKVKYSYYRYNIKFMMGIAVNVNN